MRMGYTTEVPPGSHEASFAGATPTTHDEYGPGVQWKFQIEKGENAGAIVSRTTKDIASQKNTCGKFWEMVSGLSFEVAIQHDTDIWIGDVGTIVLEPAPSGSGIRVASFVRHDHDTPF